MKSILDYADGCVIKILFWGSFYQIESVSEYIAYDYGNDPGADYDMYLN